MTEGLAEQSTSPKLAELSQEEGFRDLGLESKKETWVGGGYNIELSPLLFGFDAKHTKIGWFQGWIIHLCKFLLDNITLYNRSRKLKIDQKHMCFQSCVTSCTNLFELVYEYNLSLAGKLNP